MQISMLLSFDLPKKNCQTICTKPTQTNIAQCYDDYQLYTCCSHIESGGGANQNIFQKNFTKL